MLGVIIFFILFYILRMHCLSKDEWCDILSQLYNAPFHKDNFVKVSNALTQINISVKYNKQLITSTALMVYGKYYVIQHINTLKRQLSNEEVVYYACACFFIATKITNYLCSVDTVIKAVGVGERNKQHVKKEVLRLEMEILIKINFEVNFDMAYNYVKVIKDGIYGVDMDMECVRTWVYYINDSFLIPLYVRYSAFVIALACLQMVMVHFNKEFDVKEVVCKGEWDTLVDVEEVEECVGIIKELIYSEEVIWGRKWIVDSERNEKK